MITSEFANQFAGEWLSAWNSHNLDLILSHYADDFEMISPYIVAITGEPSGTLQGKKAVGQYWATALAKYPGLYFDLRQVLIGVQSVVIYYQGISGMAAETFIFNQEGKVMKSIAHYE
ncbi:nuclear transport factor 2 family protein [Polynucleobacter sp. JS-Safj-400b-B2]|uniref:nuclear transport factor 2 family protein n=1 Tax=Polynucleobacter sp. JS-Safj-400b-B2 TaxID=2576921 RepID=UPI001C0C17D0|nr:nuclear transport factor 2 family protein [Polynucleobacter sp. JS-Safj-400b-B2]